jgi:uncharacterized protein YabE (DUF348 family)
MKPSTKSYKRKISLKKLLVFLTALAISVSAGAGVYSFLEKDVIINDNGKVISVKTFRNTVEEVLEGSKISKDTEDYISTRLDSRLSSFGKNEIIIKRAVPVTLIIDGKNLKRKTYADTVSNTLTNLGYKVGPLDKIIGLKLDSMVESGTTIKLMRVKEEKVSQITSVPYVIEKKADDRLDKGTEKVIREGKQGIREKLFKVIYEDGKQIAKTLISDSVVSNPISQLVHFGTVMNFKTSRGDLIRYKKVMRMKATAYTSSFHDTGKSPGDPGFGITYSGMKARRGVIAVDPRVIPIGTRLYVEVLGRTPDYGFAIAGDTGGAIKGSKVDLYFDNTRLAKNFGVKSVRVYVLKD